MRPPRTRRHRGTVSAGSRPLGQRAPVPKEVTLPPETRAEATQRVTCQVAAWLWHTRGCRAMARELGIRLDGSLSTAWNGKWRVDMAGVSEDLGKTTSYVIEVKGTHEDLARENVASVHPKLTFHSKWHQPEFAKLHELWLACGDIRTGQAAVSDVPGHWGVMVFARDHGRATVLRRPSRVAHDVGSPCTSNTWRAIAQVATAEDMPAFFNARRKIQPWQALLNVGYAGESVSAKRDNKQISLFEAFEANDAS